MPPRAWGSAVVSDLRSPGTGTGRQKCLRASGTMENRKHQLLPWAGPWLPPLTRSWLLRDSEPTPRPLGVHVIWLLWCSKEFSRAACSRGLGDRTGSSEEDVSQGKGKKPPQQALTDAPGPSPRRARRAAWPGGFLVHAQGPDATDTCLFTPRSLRPARALTFKRWNSGFWYRGEEARTL